MGLIQNVLKIVFRGIKKHSSKKRKKNLVACSIFDEMFTEHVAHQEHDHYCFLALSDKKEGLPNTDTPNNRI